MVKDILPYFLLPSYVLVHQPSLIPTVIRKYSFSLAQIMTSSPGTLLLVTSRQFVRGGVGKRFSGAIKVGIALSGGSVRRYLSVKLADGSNPQAIASELRSIITRTIQEVIAQIILLTRSRTLTVKAPVSTYVYRGGWEFDPPPGAEGRCSRHRVKKLNLADHPFVIGVLNFLDF
ncbi:hypothetical protein HOY80DRAFT_1134115 [Tuber brumale]|nr:hypothetical protein HOY80DRAFT_1134115 [Tuber brumale]